MTLDDAVDFVVWCVLLAFGAAMIEVWWERQGIKAAKIAATLARKLQQERSRS